MERSDALQSVCGALMEEQLHICTRPWEDNPARAVETVGAEETIFFFKGDERK